VEKLVLTKELTVIPLACKIKSIPTSSIPIMLIMIKIHMINPVQHLTTNKKKIEAAIAAKADKSKMTHP
jgi:hypothetical protein